jgi:hypothetical protein
MTTGTSIPFLQFTKLMQGVAIVAAVDHFVRGEAATGEGLDTETGTRRQTLWQRAIAI